MSTKAMYEQHIDGFGTVRIAPIDPIADLDVIYAWVTAERARFWGMNGFTRDQVRETYAYLDSLTTHHGYLVRRNGEPVAIFQTYDPNADRVSECYTVEPGDIGVHLLLAPAPAPVPAPTSGNGELERGFTHQLITALMAFVFSDPSCQRIIGEPDAGNEKAIARLLRAGFERGPQITLPEINLPEVYLPEKRAQLAFLRRKTNS